MTQRLKELCPKIVAVLEGGYNLMSIANSSEATFRALMSQEINTKGISSIQHLFSIEMIKTYRPCKAGLEAVDISVKILQNHWALLGEQSLIDYENSVQVNIT